MGFRRSLLCLLPLLAGAAHAQDVLKAVSPDGQLEFRLFAVMPAGSGLNTLAYQVWLHGKPLMDTSCLGWNIHFQEPVLGENVGLSWSKTTHEAGYNGLVADYLQNSSTGRRLRLEVRVWNDGVAFRYLLPQQSPLLDLLIEDEATEFHFARDSRMERPAQAPLPYVESAAGAGWVSIFESHLPGFPPMSLVRTGAHTMMSHLPDRPHDPGVAFAGETPWTSPWRMIVIGPDREKLAQSDVVRGLADR
jgi:alpha-glucosidase